MVYEFEGTAETLANLVRELETRKEELDIIDWGITQATLDDVFLKLCGDAGHDG